MTAMTLATLLTAAAAAAQGGFDPQDAWSVWKAMEPASTPNCATRACDARDGGLTSFRGEAGNYQGVVVSWFRPDIQLFYVFRGCKEGMTGCTSLEIYGSPGQSPDAARWTSSRAANPQCNFQVDSYNFYEIGLTISLSQATRMTDITAAKQQVEVCTRAASG